MVTPTVAQDGDGVGLDLSKEDVQKLAEDAKKSRCFIFYCSNYFLAQIPMRKSSKSACTFCHHSITKKVSDNSITASE